MLSIATAAVLCGARGYKAIADWAQTLSPKVRARFRCRYRDRTYWVPSESILRNVLIRVCPGELNQAFQRWNAHYGAIDERLAIDIQGKTLTADALLTQRELARYRVEDRHAHYHFTVKGNQKTLLEDTAFYFDRLARKPDHSNLENTGHGRIETRNIWVINTLNDYLNFPYVKKAFRVERITFYKKSGKQSRDVAYGITRKTPEQASPAQVLRKNREHGSIEKSCQYIIDWNFDADRSRIRAGQGPENMTRLRRFAVGFIKSKGVRSVAQKMRELTLNTRLVFDYLKMTRNTYQSSPG